MHMNSIYEFEYALKFIYWILYATPSNEIDRFLIYWIAYYILTTNVPTFADFRFG